MKNYKFDPNWEKDLRQHYRKRSVKIRRNKDIVRSTLRQDEINWDLPASAGPWVYHTSYEYKGVHGELNYKKEAMIRTKRGNIKIVGFTFLYKENEYDTYFCSGNDNSHRLQELNIEFNELVYKTYNND